MAEGDLSLRISGWPEGSIFRPFVSQELNVAANGQLNVEVQAKKGVRLIGELITADTKVPIDNCKLFCELPQEIAQFVCIVEIATTKKDGVFEIWCLVMLRNCGFMKCLCQTIEGRGRLPSYFRKLYRRKRGSK